MLVREVDDELDVYIMHCDVYRARNANGWFVVQGFRPNLFDIIGHFETFMSETMIIHSCKMVYSNDNQVH